jgi:ATP-binding cassette, subfamily B, bacterial
MVKIVWRASNLLFVAMSCVTVALGLVPLVDIYLNSRLIQLLFEAIRSANALHSNSGGIIFTLIGLATTSVTAFFLNQLNATITTLYRIRAANYIQNAILEKAAGMDLEFFENPVFHNQMQTASNEGAYRPLAIVQQLVQVAASATTLVSLGIVVALWHAWLIPIIFVASTTMFFVSKQLSARNLKLNLARVESDRKGYYLRSMLTNDFAAKELRMFNLQQFFLTKIREIWESVYSEETTFARKKLLAEGITGSLVALTNPLLIAYAAWQLLSGFITIGRFTLYIQSMVSFSQNIKGLGQAFGQLHEHNIFLASLRAFLAVEPKVEGARVPGSEKNISDTPTIEFRNVCFRYPGTDRWVLEDIDFVLQPGEVIALVGDNGAGKTTIVKLLAGLYEVTSGEILLDGVSIRTLERTVLRNYFSMILQDFVIYHLSAYENIGVGRVEKIGDRAAIEEVGRITGLDEIIDPLPFKYETLLGRFFDRGHYLSGGQRQLVALARALFRKAPILVMDEPTSALDVHHERRFFKKLLGETRSRKQSVLFVSHRFGIVQHADRVLVIKNGKIIEDGSHSVLMEINGYYKEMFNLQLQMYGDSWLTNA